MKRLAVLFLTVGLILALASPVALAVGPDGPGEKSSARLDYSYTDGGLVAVFLGNWDNEPTSVLTVSVFTPDGRSLTKSVSVPMGSQTVLDSNGPIGRSARVEYADENSEISLTWTASGPPVVVQSRYQGDVSTKYRGFNVPAAVSGKIAIDDVTISLPAGTGEAFLYGQTARKPW